MQIRKISLLTMLWVSSVAVGCTPSSNLPTNTAEGTCAPTDQYQYVYRPARLQLITPCVRAAGTIIEISLEADGDYHIDLGVDPGFENLLNDANKAEGGYLIVEPICQIAPLQAESIRLCASNPNPFLDPLPKVGDHVWIEGSYVLDLQHHAWAELHPLYRWGYLKP